MGFITQNLRIFPLIIAVASQSLYGQTLPAFEKLAAEVATTSPAVAAKQAGVTQADAITAAAKWQFYPSPSAQFNEFHQGDADRSVTVGLSQPLWTFGRLTAGLAAARARGREADDAVIDAQNTVVLRFADLYQGYVASRRRLAAQQGGVRRLIEMNDMMIRRMDSGVSAKVDEALSISRLAAARSDLLAEEATGRSLLAQLEQLLGRRVRDSEIPDDKAIIAPIEATPAMLERALANHPSILHASADIEALQGDAKQQRAAMFPTVALQVSRLNYINPQPGTLNTNQIFLSLQYQPGAGLSALAQTRAAEAQVTAAQDTLEATKRDIATSLVSDAENYRMAEARFEDVQRTVDSSAEVLASFERLFVAGKRSWLDVVNAARELTQAEVTMADLSALLLIGPYRLRLRMGEKVWM